MSDTSGEREHADHFVTLEGGPEWEPTYRSAFGLVYTTEGSQMYPLSHLLLMPERRKLCVFCRECKHIK